MGFFEYHNPTARAVICTSLERMVAAFDVETQTGFLKCFAEPMAKSSKVSSWKELPLDMLCDLHDLCARTEPSPMTTHPEAAPARASDTEPVAFLIEHKSRKFDPELELNRPGSRPITPADKAAGFTAKPLYTADALATARAEGRAEGMREAAGIAYAEANNWAGENFQSEASAALYVHDAILAAIPETKAP